MLRIVDENLDECVLCELCLEAAPDGAVVVKKLYDGTELRRKRGRWEAESVDHPHRFEAEPAIHLPRPVVHQGDQEGELVAALDGRARRRLDDRSPVTPVPVLGRGGHRLDLTDPPKRIQDAGGHHPPIDEDPETPL